MLSIRLQRIGKSKQAYFRLILQEKTANPKSKNLEILGSFDPRSGAFEIKEDRVKHWLSVGAEATNTVHNMLIDKSILSGPKKKTAKIVKPEAEQKQEKQENQENQEKSEIPAAEEPKAEVAEAAPVAAEVVEEKPAEEIPTETIPAPETPAE